MMTKISKAEFKRRIKAGSKWTLVAKPIIDKRHTPPRVIHPDADNERTVLAVKPKEIEFSRGDGYPSCLPLADGDTYEIDGSILKITDQNGHWLEYHPR